MCSSAQIVTVPLCALAFLMLVSASATTKYRFDSISGQKAVARDVELQRHPDPVDQILAGEERAMFTASVDAKRPIGGGDVELAVDFTALHCFDSESGDALAVRRSAQPVG